MLTDTEKTALKESWAAIQPKADAFAASFYAQLFVKRPEYQRLFKSDMAAQRQKLIATLGYVVSSITWPADRWQDNPETDVLSAVGKLGRKHTEQYHVPMEAYAAVGEALLDTLSAFGTMPEAISAWTKLYEQVSLLMRLGGGS